MFYNNGSLRVMAADALAEQRAIFDRLRIPYELLTPAEVPHRWPQVDFDEYESVFYEPAGGVVKGRESMIPVAEEIGRTACRERGGQYGETQECHVSLNNK